MKQSTGYEPGWDLDLPEGELAEGLALDVLTGGRHEVKWNRKVAQMGTVFIETSCNNRPSRWLHESDYLTLPMPNGSVVVVPMSRVRELVFKARLKGHEKTAWNSDVGYRTKGVVVRVTDLLGLPS